MELIAKGEVCGNTFSDKKVATFLYSGVNPGKRSEGEKVILSEPNAISYIGLNQPCPERRSVKDMPNTIFTFF